MKSLFFNGAKLCDVTSSEYDALCLLFPYWGLQPIESGSEITGALSTFMLGIHGLSQEKVKEVRQLLQHTGIRISVADHEKCHQRFYVDFHENHPMPLALKTPDRQLYYLNPASKANLPLHSSIHKGITLKRKNGPLYLAVQPQYESDVSEWISYLVIQAFLRSHFESLVEMSEATFTTCADKVLKPINESFYQLQRKRKETSRFAESVSTEKKAQSATKNTKLPSEQKNDEDDYEKFDPFLSEDTVKKISVPPIQPFYSSGSLITDASPKPFEPSTTSNRNVQPINPFKSKPTRQRPIQPFQYHEFDSGDSSIIRPFQAKEHTISSPREYNAKESRSTRKRRDRK